MSRPPATVFLERRSYRRRRLTDAARMLPLVGALLFLVPLLWAGGDDSAARTAAGGVFIFAVWGALIVIAGALSRHLIRPDPDRAPDGDGAGDTERGA
ncbi:MAG: hypothetical protein QNJ16_19735 [Rhodobacter sp.]|nr:hypothetical protein [Rhodobacter sp.]